MIFKLLTSLNKSAQETETHRAHLSDIISEQFGEEAVSSIDEYEMIWESADDHVRNLSEQGNESAAMSRAGEMDWVQSTVRDNRLNQAAKNKALGIKPKGSPETGHIVVLSGGLGKIVATQPEDRKVIIQNSTGVEKVFDYDQLIGPKKVNGKLAWALKGSV